jgi:hypothetical protein
MEDTMSKKELKLYDRANIISDLRELLDEELDHPESMANGHGRALAVAIEVLEEQYLKLEKDTFATP